MKQNEFVPLFEKIDKLLEKESVIVAIEGGSASGKTTLSNTLKSIYNCTVFRMDDFFLRPEQRTPERFKEVGGNVDRERFLKEVLVPIGEKKTVKYRRFDCSTFSLEKSEEIFPEKLIIIEGAYSMHPDLRKYYDFSVFLDISSNLQKKRILKRNSPDMAERFFNEWIPMENTYFSEMKIKEKCDLCINIEE